MESAECLHDGGDALAPEHVLTRPHVEATVKEYEAGFQQAIIVMAKYLGWKVYHTYDSRRSDPGFPDLVLVRGRVLYREVKSDTGRLTKEQKEWIDLLRIAGQDVDVWRPADWNTIEKELT